MLRDGLTKDAGFTLIELLIVVAIIGIIATIGIPVLVRARTSANEAQVLGDTRTVLSGSTAYASANCGLYAPSITNLTRENGGSIGIPFYPTGAPQFLGGDVARSDFLNKSGYQRTYNPGAQPGGTIPTQCQQNAVSSYCYESQPTSANLSGVRAFVGTSAGALYVDSSGNPCTCTGAPLAPPASCVSLQ